MPYRAPLAEYEFLLSQIVGFDQVSATERFSDASSDMVSAILAEAGKVSEEVMSPLQRGGGWRTA